VQYKQQIPVGGSDFSSAKAGLDHKAVVRALALTTFVFSLLVWLYVILIQVTHPEWLPYQFSHLDYPPFNWRLDEVGMVAFGLAAIGFFVWRVNAPQ
jgi:hypothetical protein